MKYFELESVALTLKQVALEYTSHDRRDAKLIILRDWIKSINDSDIRGVRKNLLAATYLIERAIDLQYHSEVRTTCFMALDMVDQAIAAATDDKRVAFVLVQNEQESGDCSGDESGIPF